MKKAVFFLILFVFAAPLLAAGDSLDDWLSGKPGPQYQGPRAKEAVVFVKNYHLSRNLTIGKMVQRSLGKDIIRWTAWDLPEKNIYAVAVEYHNAAIIGGKLCDSNWSWTVDLFNQTIDQDELDDSIREFGNGKHEPAVMKVPRRIK